MYFRDDEEDDRGTLRVNVWGLAGSVLGALAVITASVVGVWALTVLLAVLGLAAVAWGWVATREERHTRDRVWLSLGGVLSGGVLLLALACSGLLNPRWPADVAVAASDPNKLELADRGNPDVRQPLGDGEWADAATQAIRQDDVLVRLESAQAGPVSGRGSTSYLLIHFRLANIGRTQDIPFEGFSKHTHAPVLKDGAGRSFAFLEQRPRLVARGDPVFGEPGPQSLSVTATVKAESLLVFELPSPGPWFLEVPASAWGRDGMCRLRIKGYFDSTNRK
jgi:hypothetical protein